MLIRNFKIGRATLGFTEMIYFCHENHIPIQKGIRNFMFLIYRYN